MCNIAHANSPDLSASSRDAHRGGWRALLERYVDDPEADPALAVEVAAVAGTTDWREIVRRAQAAPTPNTWIAQFPSLLRHRAQSSDRWAAACLDRQMAALAETTGLSCSVQLGPVREPVCPFRRRHVAVLRRDASLGAVPRRRPLPSSRGVRAGSGPLLRRRGLWVEPGRQRGRGCCRGSGRSAFGRRSSVGPLALFGRRRGRLRAGHASL